MLAPIAIFAYNRPIHLRRTLLALTANMLVDQTELTIFCDGARQQDDRQLINEVHSIASSAHGFASVRVVIREKNLGCANAIITGLTEMFAENDSLIVIEDDILTSPYTLSFLNTCLDKYKNSPSIFNVAAWSPPPSLMPLDPEYPYDAYACLRFNCWGWATWRNRFERVDWEISDYELFKNSPILQEAYNGGGTDLTPLLKAQMSGQINTWDIRMDYARFKLGMVGINPVHSYTTNIGCDGTGTHYTGAADTRMDNDISLAPAKAILPDHIFLHQPIVHAYKKAVSPPTPLPFWKRALNKAARLTFGRNILQ